MDQQIPTEAPTDSAPPVNKISPEVIPLVVHNPLMDRIIMPGETFRLPSGGIFYKDGELTSDVVDGEVHILPMTAIDEIVIKSPDMLYSGKAIVDVFNRCIPQILKPMELLAKDVDFLLICLRKVSFGEQLELKHTHNCEDAKEHSYMISMNEFIKKSKRIDPTSVANTYAVTLDNGQTVHLQPIRYQSFVELMQLNDNDFSAPEEIKDIMFKTLMNVIISVDDIQDKTMILQWLNKLSVGWLKKINQKIELTVDWGPSFDASVVCKDCEQKMEVTAPLNPVAFFT